MKATIHGLVKACRAPYTRDEQVFTTARITATGLSHDLVVKLAGEHKLNVDDDVVIIVEDLALIHGEAGGDGERGWKKYAYFFSEDPAFFGLVGGKGQLKDVREGRGFQSPKAFDLDRLYVQTVATGYLESRECEGKDGPFTAWSIRVADGSLSVSFDEGKEPKKKQKATVVASGLSIRNWTPKAGGAERFAIALRRATWVDAP